MIDETQPIVDGTLTLQEISAQRILDRFEESDWVVIACEPGWNACVTAGALVQLLDRLQRANNTWLAGQWLNMPLGELLRPIARESDEPPATSSRRPPPLSTADALIRALDTEPEAFEYHSQMSEPPAYIGEADEAAPPEEAAESSNPLDQASGGGESKGGLGGSSGSTGIPTPPSQPPAEESLQREEIRLDVVTPETAMVNEPFDMAVAIRQPHSPALTVEDLPKLTSAMGEVYRDAGQNLIKYRVEVEVDDCEVRPARYDFLLAKGRDSIVQYFQLTPKRAGNLSIVVNAYQADSAVLAATTRVRLKAGVSVLRDATAPAHADTIKLYDALTGLFQLDDVQDIAFRMHIKWDELAGDTLSAKCRSLLTYCNDRSLMDQLRQTIKILRPDASL
jgi:hypothetical protein